MSICSPPPPPQRIITIHLITKLALTDTSSPTLKVQSAWIGYNDISKSKQPFPIPQRLGLQSGRHTASDRLPAVQMPLSRSGSEA